MQRKFYDINRYLKSIANDEEITCDEIIDVSRNSNDIKAKIKMDSLYCALFLFLTTLLSIVVIVFYYFISLSKKIYYHMNNIKIARNKELKK